MRAARDAERDDGQPPLLVLEPLELLLLAVSLEPEEPLLEADGVDPLPLEGWSLDELLELLEGELELGVLEDELPLLSLLFIARLPLDEPDDPDGLVEEPDGLDCERRESLPRSQAESPKVAASAAARAVRKNLFCTMSTIS